jgi:hypothetical protein
MSLFILFQNKKSTSTIDADDDDQPIHPVGGEGQYSH